MKKEFLFVSIFFSFSMTGCVSSPTAEAPQRSTTRASYTDGLLVTAHPTMISPTSMTAAEFEKMDNKNKALHANGLIKQVWNKECNATKVMLGGKFMGETNNWHVACKNSDLDYDYSIFLPAPKAPNGQVLPCFRSQSGSMGCSISARPRS